MNNKKNRGNFAQQQDEKRTQVYQFRPSLKSLHEKVFTFRHHFRYG